MKLRNLERIKMTREELIAQGWIFAFEGPCDVKAWGNYIIHLHHTSGRLVSGYGVDEAGALADAVASIKKPSDTIKP
jgi:hypothetical protein